jgi:hypothetical protein
MIDPKLKKQIIYVVTAVWALNFLVGIIPWFDYKPDQAINAIFMAIVGGLFAISERRPSNREDSKDKKEIEDKDSDREEK